MTDEEVQEALIEWVKPVTGVTAIKDRQGLDRPCETYMTVEIGPVIEIRERPTTTNYEKLVDTDEVIATPNMEMEWTMLVIAYGKEGRNALRKIKQAAHVSQIQETMLPTLKIHETGAINNIPEEVNNEWEPRSSLNVMLRGVSTDGFVIDTIERHTPFDIKQTNRNKND